MPMADSGYRTLHRIVKTDPPTVADFLSNAAQGHQMPADPARQAVWEALSAYSTLPQARRKRRASPILGRYIAVLHIPIDGPVTFERTFGEGHFTVRGDPEELLRMVVSVVPA